MLFYFSVYAFVILLALLAERWPNARIARLSRRDVLWFLAFLVLFAVSALRFDVGTDYSSRDFYLGYVEVYRVYADGGSMRFGVDPGFLALIRLVRALGGNPQLLFVITSAIVCGLVVRACRRVSCSPALSLALFLVAGLYLESFNIVRQWIAIACVLNGFAWVGWSGEDGDAHLTQRRSFPRYAAWVAAGAIAHPSALFWLLLWPLFGIRLNARRALLLVVVFVVAAYLGWNALAVILEGTRYGRYFHDPTGLYTTSHIRVNAIVTTICSLAFTLWAYRGREGLRGRGEAVHSGGGSATTSWWGRWASALTVCQCALLALLVSEAFLPYIVDRVARYLMPLLVLQLPWALREVEHPCLRRALAVGVCACWLAASTVQFVGGKDDVLPYRSILTTPRDEVSELFDTPPVIPEADRPLTDGETGARRQVG